MKLDVKICGLKTAEAMEAAISAGATHVGLIFFARSPRNIAPQAAAKLRKLAEGRAKVVAVTVDAPDAMLDEIVATVRPDLLQLHGSETPERVENVKARYGLPVIKALPIRDRADLSDIAIHAKRADRLLFDAKPPENADVPGGRGESFDWNLLAALDPGIDYMLSGGLHAGNIAWALSIVSPRGIDVSSGVETAPGVKSPQRISEFFAALTAAACGGRER